MIYEVSSGFLKPGEAPVDRCRSLRGARGWCDWSQIDVWPPELRSCGGDKESDRKVRNSYKMGPPR